MSEENVEIVRQVYKASARRDADTVLAFYDPGIEWDSTRVPWGRLVGGPDITRGHEGLREWFREYSEAWESIEDDFKELIDVGHDRVISVVRTRGRGRASGLELEFDEYAAIWTIDDGKIVRVVWFPSREQALEAAGLSE
jgi:ketosteroid isomerase-like protein